MAFTLFTLTQGSGQGLGQGKKTRKKNIEKKRSKIILSGET